jgi:hypothetical protein
VPSKSNSKFIETKDIGVALNNAVAAAFGSKDIKDLSPLETLAIRNYMAAILEIVIEHHKQEYLTGAQLVAAFSAGALFLHVFLVAKGGESKLTMYQNIAKQLLEDEKLKA